MDEDRTTWGAQEYAAALNSAATPQDLFELVQEVNQKWAVGSTDRVPSLKATRPAK